MKKMTALLLAALMVLSMAACASKPAETAESDLAYIQDKGTLVVGITDFAPMDYQNESGEWVGFDADLAKAFGRVPRRQGGIRRDRLGQQGSGARQQDHRLRLERHDAHVRGHKRHGVLQRLLQQRAGRDRPG